MLASLADHPQAEPLAHTVAFASDASPALVLTLAEALDAELYKHGDKERVTLDCTALGDYGVPAVNRAAQLCGLEPLGSFKYSNATGSKNQHVVKIDGDLIAEWFA